MGTDLGRTGTRIGIIGTGKHGSRYAKHLVGDVDGLHLAAISRRAEEGRAQAENWLCYWYQDWQELVAASDVDAVIAVVPPMLNLEIARACTAYKKPLLMEKPLAGNGADAAAITELFLREEVLLTVGQTLRYNSTVQGFKKYLKRVGQLYSFSACQRLEPSTLGWHEDPTLAGAGVSFHTAIHVFDALRYITGLECTRVMAVTRKQHNQGLEDLLAVLVEMEDGVVGTVDCSKVGHARSGRFEFVGEQGTLCGDQIFGSCELVQGALLEELPIAKPTSTIVPLLREWRDLLQGRGPNPVPGKDGLAAVQICEACLQSAAQGAWVSL